MSDDLSEDYRAWNEAKRDKRSLNLESSIRILQTEGIAFKQLSDTHFRIGEFDFWPSTGLFLNRKTKKRGRGIFSLVTKVKYDNN